MLAVDLLFCSVLTQPYAKYFTNRLLIRIALFNSFKVALVSEVYPVQRGLCSGWLVLKWSYRDFNAF